MVVEWTATLSTHPCKITAPGKQAQQVALSRRSEPHPWRARDRWGSPDALTLVQMDSLLPIYPSLSQALAAASAPGPHARHG
jgi:hypothetical protein